MKPKPCRLASVQRRVLLAASKYDRTGGDDKDFFAAMNASSWLGDHKKSFLVLNSGRREDSNGARVSVL